MNKAKYFKDAEFMACDPPCSIEDMDARFLSLLDDIRQRAGIPLVLNCAYRSRQHDLAKGRSGNSAHTRGKAVDIRCSTSQNRLRIVTASIECGINRIGIGRNFVHIDRGDEDELPKNVMWHYY